MSAIKSFVSTTLVGGLMFLVPVALLLVVLRHAMQFAGKVAKPIAANFPATEIVGIGVVSLVAAFILLLIAFVAGLLARSAPGRKVTHWFEESIFGGLPQYRMVKSMAEGLAQIEGGHGMHPVLYRGDEGWQIAYRLEELADGWVAIFLPASPTPMSGNILYVQSFKVRPLGIGMPAAMKLIKGIGIGSADALRGVDLSPPREP